MKRLILAAFIGLASFGAVELSTPKAQADPVDCSFVKCPACPEGTVFSPTNGNCCRCVRA